MDKCDEGSYADMADIVRTRDRSQCQDKLKKKASPVKKSASPCHGNPKDCATSVAYANALAGKKECNILIQHWNRSCGCDHNAKRALAKAVASCHRERNREKDRVYRRAYRNKNKDKIAECRRQCSRHERERNSAARLKRELATLSLPEVKQVVTAPQLLAKTTHNVIDPTIRCSTSANHQPAIVLKESFTVVKNLPCTTLAHSSIRRISEFEGDKKSLRYVSQDK